jgi:DNA-binding transcriptional ArsR family regulator
MGKRGRPVKSQIRQRIVDILYFMKEGYGYGIYKVYCDIFPKVSQRVVYYHLKKGEAIGEFKIVKVIKEKGNYSWGGEAEKVYYSLGKNANPTVEKRVKEYFEKK